MHLWEIAIKFLRLGRRGVYYAMTPGNFCLVDVMERKQKGFAAASESLRDRPWFMII